MPIVAAVSSVVAGAVRRDRRLDLVAGRPARAPGPTSTSSPRPPRPRSRSVGGAERGKAIIILNPVEPPMIMRNTVFCAIPAEAAEPGDAQDATCRVDARDGRRRCRSTCPATACAPTRSSTQPREHWDGHGPGRRLPRGHAAAATTCPTTPATSTSSPRPPPGSASCVASGTGRGLSDTGACTTVTSMTDGTADAHDVRHHRLDPARRLARDAAPVHRGAGARRRARARRAPACRSSRSPTATASAAPASTTASPASTRSS